MKEIKLVNYNIVVGDYKGTVYAVEGAPSGTKIPEPAKEITSRESIIKLYEDDASEAFIPMPRKFASDEEVKAWNQAIPRFGNPKGLSREALSKREETNG